MRIAGVDLDLLDVPLRRAIVTAAGERAAIRLALLLLRTDDGPEGWGEVVIDGLDVAPATEVAAGWASSAATWLAHRLVGLDLLDPMALPAWPEATGAWRDAAGAWPGGPALQAAVTAAILGARARARGITLAAVLAAHTAAHSGARLLAAVPAPHVAINALLGMAGVEETAAEARSLVEQGFGCLKLKAGAEPIPDILRRVAAVRESVGPLVALRLDLNGRLDETTATALLEDLARYRLEYVEQPLPVSAGAAGLARLRRAVRVPIAADEIVTDPVSLRELAAAGSVDAVVIKPARVGGLLVATALADLALASDMRVTVATGFETGVGVAAALHLAALLPQGGAHGLSTAGLLASDLLLRPLAVHHGHMELPLEPGLGVAVDPSALERFRAEESAHG